MVLALTMGFSLVSFPLWVVPWTQEFGLARGTVMVAFAGCALTMSLSGPLVGALVARLSVRWVVVIGASFMAAGLALVASATSFWEIAALYGTLIGLGVGLAGMLTGQILAIQSYPERAGAAGGLVILGLSLGSAVVPAAIAPIVAASGWRAAFLAAAAILAFVAVPLALLLLASPGKATPALAGTPPAAADWAIVLKASAFWIILSGIFPIIVALAAIQSNIIAIGADAGMTLSTGSYLVTLTAAGTAIGAVTIGWLADRHDPRIVYTGIAIVIILSMLALVGQRDFGVFAGALALFGFAGGGAMPLMGVLIVRAFGAEEFPRVFGLVGPFLIPAVAGPVADAWIRDATGSYDLAFVLTAGLMVPGVIMMWRMSPTACFSLRSLR
jgi:MFS family permease